MFLNFSLTVQCSDADNGNAGTFTSDAFDNFPSTDLSIEPCAWVGVPAGSIPCIPRKVTGSNPCYISVRPPQDSELVDGGYIVLDPGDTLNFKKTVDIGSVSSTRAVFEQITFDGNLLISMPGFGTVCKFSFPTFGSSPSNSSGVSWGPKLSLGNIPFVLQRKCSISGSKVQISGYLKLR